MAEADRAAQAFSLTYALRYRLRRSRLDQLPFVKAVGRDQSSSPPEAARYLAVVSTVSTRVLIVLYAIFSSLAHLGIMTHRNAAIDHLSVSGLSRIARMFWRG
jgi:NADH:ubiquinone oxidoreductase subunit D